MEVFVVGMHIFLAHFLLLRILADSTPPASVSVPIIGKRSQIVQLILQILRTFYVLFFCLNSSHLNSSLFKNCSRKAKRDTNELHGF